MSLPALALFTRSLRLDARKIGLYLFRVGLVVVIGISLFFAHMSAARQSAPGLGFFTATIVINFICITLAGIGYFSSVITEEKESMTLGLLKMAGLNSLSVLMGNSTSRLLAVLTLVVVQLPFTLLAITLGGVSIDQVLAAYVSMLAYIFFLANMALFASVCSSRTGRALAMTALMLIVFFLAPVVGDGLRGLLVDEEQLSSAGALNTSLTWIFQTWKQTSVLTRVWEILTTGFEGGAFGFQVISNFVMGVFFFGLSWAAFGIFTRQSKESSPSRGFLPMATSRLGALGAGRTWRSALLWKDFHYLAGGKFGIYTRFVLMGILYLVMSYFFGPHRERPLDFEDFGGFIMITALVMASLEMLVQTSRIFQVEYKWRTLPSIVMLPMSIHRLALIKVAACLLGLIPYLAFFIIGVALATEPFFDVIEDIFEEPEAVLGFALMFADGLLLLYMTAFLSLVVRRAALFLAFGCWLLGNFVTSSIISLIVMTFFVRFSFSTSPIPFFLVSLLGVCTLCGLLHWGTLRLIRFRAAR